MRLWAWARRRRSSVFNLLLRSPLFLFRSLVSPLLVLLWLPVALACEHHNSDLRGACLGWQLGRKRPMLQSAGADSPEKEIMKYNSFRLVVTTPSPLGL